MNRRPWGLWARQIVAIVRLEVRKTFLGKRSIPVYILAILPVIPFAARAIFAPFKEDLGQLSGAITIYGVVFQTFILRFCLYFGCVAIFANLFRGEVLDRSLHYYFLAPVKREVLVVGKYLSGLVAGSVVFGATTAVSALLIYVPHGKARAIEHLFHGPGLSHLFWYMVVTILACVGYGAVFLVVGSSSRTLSFRPSSSSDGSRSSSSSRPSSRKSASPTTFSRFARSRSTSRTSPFSPSPLPPGWRSPV